MLLLVEITLLSRCLVCMNLKVSVTNVMVQCPDRQKVEDFGVLRSDAVYLGARFPMSHPNVAKHSSSDSIVSHTWKADYR